jgi:hypothetical protein
VANSTWIGGIDGNWSTAGNWSAGVPGSADTATFNTNPGVVLIDMNPIQIGTISLVGVNRAVAFAGAGILDTSANAFGIQVSFNSTGQTLVIACGIDGDNGLAIVGAGGAGGTLTLSGTNTFGGTFLMPIIAGTPSCTVTAGDPNCFGTSTIALTSGTLNFNAQAVTNNITYTGGSITNASVYSGTLTLASTSTITVGTNITNTFAGTLVVSAGTTLDFNSLDLAAATVRPAGGTLANAGSYAGDVSVTSGTFTVTTTPAAAAFSVSGAATLNLAGAALATTPVTMGAGSTISNGSMPAANLTINPGSGSVSIDAELTGVGGLSIPAGINAVFSEAPTFTGTLTVANTAIFYMAVPMSPPAATISLDGTVAVSNGGSSVIAGDISGAGSFFFDTASELTLTGTNAGFSGAITLSEGSTVTAGSDTSFGSGSVISAGVGVIAGFNTIDLDGYAVATSLIAASLATFGYTVVLGGENYAGTVTVQDGAKVSIPSGNELAGLINVNAGIDIGELVIEGQHTGTINNDGTVTIDNVTAAATPVNVYVGACGSTYAVQQP